MKDYTGVLVTENGKYKIYSNGEDVDLSDVLSKYYFAETKIRIKISNNRRQLLHESGELYYDRDSNKKYRLHINGINLEKILLNNFNDLITIEIQEVA